MCVWWGYACLFETGTPSEKWTRLVSFRYAYVNNFLFVCHGLLYKYSGNVVKICFLPVRVVAKTCNYSFLGALYVHTYE